MNGSFLTALPETWTIDRLKDVVRLRNEKTDVSSDIEDYLELEDLESGSGRILNRRNTLGVESSVILFSKGDILFGKLRPYLEKFYEAEFDGKCTGEILAFEPKRITGRFLFYCLASPWFIEQCNMLAYGTKMPRINWPTQLAQFNMPLPPPEEEKRIAAYLDAGCEAIDAAVAAKRKQLEILETMRKSVIHQAVTKGLHRDVRVRPSGIDWLPEIPAHWSVRHIKRRCALLRGKFSHRPRNDPALYDGPYPFIQTGDISAAQKYIEGHSQTLNELGLSVSKMFPRGTLVMSIAANIGDVAIINFEACFPDSIVGLAPDHQTSLDYLYYLLLAMKEIMLRSAVLTTQLNLNYVRIGNNYAAFPPKQEQVEIAAFLDKKNSEVQALKSVLLKQIDTLTAYRKSLIHECVTGRRRITEGDIGAMQNNVDAMKEAVIGEKVYA